MPALAVADGIVQTLETDVQESGSSISTDTPVRPRVEAFQPVMYSIGSFAVSQTAAEPDADDRSGLTTAALISRSPTPEGPPFKLLQQWEGVVSTNPSGDEFVAVLRDRTKPDMPEEQGTVSLDHVSESDRSLVVPGGVFYWSIGYEDTPSGTRRTVSMIRFRRLPAWTRGDMRRIDRDIERFRRLFAGSQ